MTKRRKIVAEGREILTATQETILRRAPRSVLPWPPELTAGRGSTTVVTDSKGVSRLARRPGKRTGPHPTVLPLESDLRRLTAAYIKGTKPSPALVTLINNMMMQKATVERGDTTRAKVLALVVKHPGRNDLIAHKAGVTVRRVQQLLREARRRRR